MRLNAPGGRWGSRHARRAVRLLGGLFSLTMLLACLGAPVAHADEQGIPRTVDELLDAYGIADEPADFVVVVDTSASMMNEPPIYPAVQEVFQAFVQAIGDNDHLAVVTFDSDAVVRFNGTMDPPGRAAAMTALPEVADGQSTDIGAALGAALERLSRPEGAQVQTLIFLTDGEIWAPGSPYEARGSAAWNDLAAQAQQLSTSRTVQVFGAGLGAGATDIGAIKDVFPYAKVVSLPNDQLYDFFNEAVQRARIEKLRLPVTQELQRNVVQVTADPATLDDTTTLSLRLESKLPHLGTTVSLRGVTVSDDLGNQLQSTLVGGPRTFTIGPQQSSEPFKVQVEVPGLIHDFHLGDATESRRFQVSVDATLEAEPAAIVTMELGVDVVPQLSQAGIIRADRAYGTPYWQVAALIALLVFIGWLVAWLYRRFIAVPKLRGGVELPDGRIFPFQGKQETLPNSRIDFNGGGSRVVIFTEPRKFKSAFNTRRPRLYVRIDQGTAKIDAYGSEEFLSETRRLIDNNHQLIIGPTRLTVVTTSKKGK